MNPLSLPINIREAKPAEFGVLGRLHALAFTDNDLCKALLGKSKSRSQAEVDMRSNGI
jgi:hypothetical protein